MGNILSGLDLLRRTSENPVECFGMCFPLLTNAEGVKMGKSVGGAIWLSSGKTWAAVQDVCNATDGCINHILSGQLLGNGKIKQFCLMHLSSGKHFCQG